MLLNERVKFLAGVSPSTPDFTIKLGVHEWKVHSRVLTAQSKYFQTLLKGSTWKVSSRRMYVRKKSSYIYQESNDKCVELVDDDPIIFARLLMWLYYGTLPTAGSDRGNFPSTGPRPITSRVVEYGPRVLDVLNGADTSRVGLSEDAVTLDRLALYVKVYILADKYMIESLKFDVIRLFGWAPDVGSRQIIKAFQDHMDFVEGDGDLKRALVRLVVPLYDQIKDAHDPDYITLWSWFKDDNSLCLLLVDELAQSLDHARSWKHREH